ncbi:MAG: hypothetical protein HZB56_07950 [Deltaproteobacteria bacterium]|nr:hypothetical protein [Deltaproteobacteria bacterium]
MLPRLALAACALLLGAPAHAGPPPGRAAPAANGTGRATFRLGAHLHSLPLTHQEVKAGAGGMTRVTVEYADDQGNQLQLTFGARAKGVVPDTQITGVVARSRAAGAARAAVGQTRCGLTLEALSDQQVSGRATCRPMFALDGRTPAHDLADLEFSVRPRRN